MNKIIEINKLSFKNVFNNFAITFPMEKLIYLSGSNNCGKTTLIRNLNRQINSKFNIIINDKVIDNNNLNEYFNNIECLIPNEILFKNDSLNEEINNYDNKVDKKELINKLKLNKYKDTKFNKLDIKNKIKIQLLISLLKKPKVLFIDNIMSYFDKKEIIELNHLLKEYISKYKITIIITTVNLENTINSDYLIIIDNNKIILEGEPLKVLEKDNIINKAGLEVPFTIDLSSKLKDYDLIKEIESDKERLINKLWK